MYRTFPHRGRRAANVFGGIALVCVSAHANMVINPFFDSTITSDANSATIINSINTVIGWYQNAFSDPITVSITFEKGGGLGSSSTFFQTISYFSYRSALNNNQTTVDDQVALSTLPAATNNPVNGNTNVDATTANLRALGFNANPPPGQTDGTVTLNTSIMNLDRNSIDPNKYDLMGVAAHEIDEVLGIGSALNGVGTLSGAVWGLDLFRFSAPGVRSFDRSATTSAYFSIDNGNTNLVAFNQTGGAADYSDWVHSGTVRVQDAFGTRGATPYLGVELQALDVIGFELDVPEPATGVLLMGGLLVAIGLKRRSAITVASSTATWV